MEIAVAIVTAVVGPLLIAWRLDRRTKRVEKNLAVVREENTVQHAAGQTVLGSLVTSHLQLIGKVDEVVGVVGEVKGWTSTHELVHQAEPPLRNGGTPS